MKIPSTISVILLTGLIALPLQAKESMSPASLDQAVARLKKEDVAWRKIAWQTCLLEGLHAAREQNKPALLWIFIDRPIDDERC